MRDALVPAGLAGLGHIIYQYLWAPSTTTLSAAFPSQLFGTPGVYQGQGGQGGQGGQNGGLIQSQPTAPRSTAALTAFTPQHAGYRSVVRNAEDDEDDNVSDSD